MFFQRARQICGALLLLSVANCSATSQPFPGLPRLSVTTQFRTENLCDIGVSPQIALSYVPKGTTIYVIQITDINVLIATPWREAVSASSKTEIPEGAAKTYVGPCIGDMARFPPVVPFGDQTRVEVLAENAQGQPLAYGAVVVYVKSPYVAAKIERAQRQGANPPPEATAPVRPLAPTPVPGEMYPGVGSGFGVLQ